MDRSQNDTVAAHYDELDPFYRRIWGEQLHHGLWRRGDESPDEAAGAMTALIGERLQLARGQRVCDVGCGYGRTAMELAGRFGVSVLGMTISLAQARRAATLPDERVEVRHGDWLRNGLPDGAFDAALAVESTEHMSDPMRAVSEMARVVRPGGRIVLCCWLRCGDLEPWERRHLVEPICREGRLAVMGREDEVRHWLAAAGLELEEAEDFSREVERTWPLCIRRGLGALLRDAEMRRFLLDRRQPNRVFAITLFRIWLAYVTGAMRYVVFTARQPG